MEDALSKGLPIRAEVNTLHKSLEGIDKDSLLDLVLSSLPEEVLNYGADTQIQLNQKASEMLFSLFVAYHITFAMGIVKCFISFLGSHSYLS